MKLSAALAAAFLAATTTALPAAAAAPARQDWGMPIINHIPVPDARRRRPELDRVVTSDNGLDDDDDLDGLQRRSHRTDKEEDEDDDDDADSGEYDHGSGSDVHRRTDHDDNDEDDNDAESGNDTHGSGSDVHRRTDHDDNDEDDNDAESGNDTHGSGSDVHRRTDHDDDHEPDGVDDDDDSAVERRTISGLGRPKPGGGPKPIGITFKHPKIIDDDGRGVDASDFENFGQELQRRGGRNRPIVDHTPVDRRAETERSSGKPVADAFWGMPVIDHIPVPDTRREVAAAAADHKTAAELESRREPFPIVDHKPAEP